MRRYRDFDRRVWVLFFSEMTVSIGFSVVIPFLAIYFHDKLGVAMSLVGLVYLARAVMAAFGSVIGGELADRIGRRKVMLFSMSSQVVAYLLIALAIAGDQDFLLIAGLVVISSVAGSLFEPAANATVADVVEPGRRLEAYGLLRVGVNMGWAVGPALGGFLAAVSYSSLFLLTAFTALISFIMILLLLSETGPKGELRGLSFRDIASVRRDHNFTLLCVISFILFIAISQMSSTLSVFANGSLRIAEIGIGYLYSLNGALIVLIQLPMARVVAGRSMPKVLALGSVVYTVGYFLMGFSDGFHFLALCMVIITMGELIVSPSIMNLVASLSPENERGRYMGVFSFFSLTGWSLGPFVGGVLIDTVVDMPVLLWGSLSIFALMAAVGYLLLDKRLPSHVGISRIRP